MGDLSSLFDPTHFNTLPIPVATPGSACVANVWGKPGVSLEAGVLLASAAGVTYDDMNSWDVGGATTMLGMFKGAAVFNQSLNSWNVAKVTNMASAFEGAALFSKEIGSWNVAKVTSMNLMFKD